MFQQKILLLVAVVTACTVGALLWDYLSANLEAERAVQRTGVPHSISAPTANATPETAAPPATLVPKAAAPTMDGLLDVWGHASCFSFTREEPNLLQLARTFGKYQPMDKNQKAPRYTTRTCPVMKARYNCAGRPTSETQAWEWQLVLQGKDNRTCPLHQFTESIGGIQAILEAWQTLHRGKSVPPLQVLLQGDSYVRQVWEALVCGFPQGMTSLVVGNGSTVLLNLDNLAEGIPFDKMGKSFDLLAHAREESLEQPRGCHGNGGTNLSEFYRRPEDVPFPVMETTCDDNLARVDYFDGAVQFYYIFRSWLYSDIQQPYDWLNLSSPLDIDYLFYDKGQRTIGPPGRRIAETYDSQNLQVLPLLKNLAQKESVPYKVFGADNPWVSHPPDGHPCMPGMPDDVVNLMVHHILTDIVRQTREGKRPAEQKE